jgi:hypothetical protein
MSGLARNSKLYDEYPELEDLNDKLLSFEDMHVISKDPAASVKSWHEFMQTLLQRAKAAIQS